MSVVIETSLGDITVDLFLEDRPRACLNFLKLCKIKYYNHNLFHTISRGFIAQTGDPTGTRSGGDSIFGVIDGLSKRFFEAENEPRIKHTRPGLISFVGDESNMVASQFFLTLGDDLTYLDEKHCVFGEIVEGFEILESINEVICDNDDRPFQDVRISHTVVLDDPYPDPKGLMVPSRSPSPSAERLAGGRIAPDEEIDETSGKSAKEIAEMQAEREAKARATILEMVGDIPDADMAPPENVLFVCKLNPITNDDDLEIIFSRFGKIKSCEVIRDRKTGDSLQYAFIEFEDQKSCEDAYFKMDNVLVDDRRLHVDFSQSVSKVKWLGKGRGVTHFDEKGNKRNADVNNDIGNGKYKVRNGSRQKNVDKERIRGQSKSPKRDREKSPSLRDLERNKRSISPRRKQISPLPEGSIKKGRSSNQRQNRSPIRKSRHSRTPVRESRSPVRRRYNRSSDPSPRRNARRYSPRGTLRRNERRYLPERNSDSFRRRSRSPRRAISPAWRADRSLIQNRRNIHSRGRSRSPRNKSRSPRQKSKSPRSPSSPEERYEMTEKGLLRDKHTRSPSKSDLLKTDKKRQKGSPGTYRSPKKKSESPLELPESRATEKRLLQKEQSCSKFSNRNESPRRLGSKNIVSKTKSEERHKSKKVKKSISEDTDRTSQEKKNFKEKVGSERIVPRKTRQKSDDKNSYSKIKRRQSLSKKTKSERYESSEESDTDSEEDRKKYKKKKSKNKVESSTSSSSSEETSSSSEEEIVKKKANKRKSNKNIKKWKSKKSKRRKSSSTSSTDSSSDSESSNSSSSSSESESDSYKKKQTKKKRTKSSSESH